MDRVSHRELRINSGEILRRAEAGESFVLTNRGRAVATIGPVPAGGLDDLVARGAVREATRPVSALRDVRRTTATRTTTDIIADVRGSW